MQYMLESHLCCSDSCCMYLFLFKQKTAYEMRISDWSSDVCSSDLNEQTFTQISEGAIVPSANDPGESAESVWTFSVSPQFHINEDAMLYGRVATGYRPGGPNVIVPNVPPSVDADRMTNYEIGLKADLADRMVSVDAAFFWMDWPRSEEHTSELQSLMRNSYAVFYLK